MTLCNCSQRLLLEIKQGTSRTYGFTIKQGGNPMDLTKYTVIFEVKPAPYYTVPDLIYKELTTTSDDRVVGNIYNPTEGQFKVTFNIEDYIKLPPNDYYLVVTLVEGTTRIIISGEGQASGIFRICKQ